jgi:5-methylcytosine-specific restriction endonuclease McrA
MHRLLPADRLYRSVGLVGTVSNHRRRKWLLEHDPHCWYCGTELVYYTREPDAGEPPDNFATIEHLHDRSLGNRPERGRRELACYRCNQERNHWANLLRDAAGLGRKFIEARRRERLEQISA